MLQNYDHILSGQCDGVLQILGASMSLNIKIEKIKFIVDELHLAFLLARSAPDDFLARTLARHIIIRVSDFINHVRLLHGVLKIASFRTKDFNIAKEAYAENFNEYFRITRDRYLLNPVGA